MRTNRQKIKNDKTTKNNKNRRRTKLGQPPDSAMNNLSLSTSDRYIAIASVTTSNGFYTLEESSMSQSGGQFATFPQMFKPYMAGIAGNSTFDFVGRLKYRRLDILLNFTGSQGNALVAGDLYNRIRVVIGWSRSPYLGTPTVNNFTVNTLLDRRDLDSVYLDTVVNLPMTAYDTANTTNCPAAKTIKKSFDLSSLPIHEIFSTANGAIWDSRQGTFKLYVVSDSSVAPNPTIAGQTRLYYEILDV
jgi:hypothetical protein